MALFSVCFLILTNILLIHILDIRRHLHIALLCALISACPVITALYAGYLPYTDIHLLSLLFSVLSVWLFLRFKWGWLLSAVSITIAMAIYPVYAEATVVLFFILIIKDLILNQNNLLQSRKVLRLLAFFVIGGIVYYVGWLIAMRMLGTTVATSPKANEYNSLNRLGDFRLANLFELLKETYRTFFYYVSRPEVQHCRQIGAVNLIVAACTFVLLAISGRNLKKIIPVAVLLLLAPLFASFVYILSNGFIYSIIVFPIVLLYSGVIMVLACDTGLDGASKTRCRLVSALRMVTTLCLCIIVLNFTVSSNQAHIKKTVEEEATLSVMTRLIDRIEMTEGYEAGSTTVVLVGDLNESSIAQHRLGYNLNQAPFWKADSFCMTYINTYRWYFQQILGYPINLANSYIAKQYSELNEVMERPVFPAIGCSRMFGDVLVVRLSDSFSILNTSNSQS